MGFADGFPVFFDMLFYSLSDPCTLQMFALQDIFHENCLQACTYIHKIPKGLLYMFRISRYEYGLTSKVS